MINSLFGKISKLTTDEITLIINNAIGFSITMTQRDLQKLKTEQDILVHTHTYLREDQIALYGFLEQEHKTLFSKLINIQGIGPKLAVAILNTLTPPDLQSAVSSQNLGLLTKIPGVGPKTAKRMLIELESIFKTLNFEQTNTQNIINDDLQLKSALKNLGFNDQNIDSAIQALDKAHPPHTLPLNEKIRWTLSWLNKLP